MNRDEFIIKNKGLVKYVARPYLRMHDNVEGLMAAGYLTLCEIAQDVLDRDIPENLHANYIVLKLKDTMRRFIASDRNISFGSHNTFFKMITEKRLPQMHNIENYHLTCPIKVAHFLIEDLKLCPRDSLILDLKIQNYNDTQIASALGLTQGRISILRQAIGEKLLDLLEDDKHDYRKRKRNVDE